MLEDFPSDGSRVLHDLEIENIRDSGERDEDSLQDIGVCFL